MDASVLAMDSPIGLLALVGDESGLVAVQFVEPTSRLNRAARLAPTALQEARRQLTAYFDQELRAFDLPLRPEGTPFQREVWDALLEVPYGQTSTYGAVAARLGLRASSASRAVGSAAGSNPLAIVIPCHRVIGADGSLVGYAGGVRRKEALLRLEGSWSDTDQLTLFSEDAFDG